MNPDDDITVEEARRRLKEMGIPIGEWQNTNPDGEREAFTIPTFVRQADKLKKLSGLIEDQISRDFNTIVEMKEKLNRLKYGGGR